MGRIVEGPNKTNGLKPSSNVPRPNWKPEQLKPTTPPKAQAEGKAQPRE